MAQATSSYGHRLPQTAGPSHGRLSDMLDYIRQEVDAINSEASTLKHSVNEYEGHAASHTQEMSALRTMLTELESEHEKMKQQYEEENGRLRQELEAACVCPVSRLRAPRAGRRNGVSSSGSPSGPAIPPAPQVGHGPSNLFGAIMGPNTSAANRGSSQTLPGPVQIEANGWDRDRDPPSFDHSAKRIRLDDTKVARDSHSGSNPPSTPNSGSSGQKNPASPAAPPAEGRPGLLSISRPGGASVLAPSDAHSPSTPSATLETEAHRAPEGHKGSTDWLTHFNPRAKRELAIELLHTLSHDSVVCCVKFSPDGSTLATGCNRSLILYDTETGRVKMTLVDDGSGRLDNYIRSACFDPTGTLIATGAEDRLIRIWNIKEERIVRTFEGHRSEIYSLAFSPDGRYLASGSGDQTAHVWNMSTGSLHFTLPAEAPIGTEVSVDAGVTSVAISPNGAFVAAGSLDTCVRVWDMASGELLERLTGHKDSVYSVAFSPDCRWLVSGSLDKTLKMWDMENLHNGGQGQTGTLTNDSKATSVAMATLSGHKDYVLSVAVSSDGRWIISGSKDRGVTFWDPKTHQASVVLQGHKNSVISTAVSDVGDLLATGSGDWQARIWKLSYVDATSTA